MMIARWSGMETSKTLLKEKRREFIYQEAKSPQNWLKASTKYGNPYKEHGNVDFLEQS